jgi:hypothetical protein
MNEMREVVSEAGPMTDAAVGRFRAGRGHLARHRAPLGPVGLVDAARRLTALLPEWG